MYRGSLLEASVLGLMAAALAGQALVPTEARAGWRRHVGQVQGFPAETEWEEAGGERAGPAREGVDERGGAVTVSAGSPRDSG